MFTEKQRVLPPPPLPRLDKEGLVDSSSACVPEEPE